jgi:hypothetical protein
VRWAVATIRHALSDETGGGHGVGSQVEVQALLRRRSSRLMLGRRIPRAVDTHTNAAEGEADEDRGNARDAAVPTVDAGGTLRACWCDAKSSLGDVKSSLGDAESSLGDAESSLGDAKSSLGDAESSLGDAESSLGYVQVVALKRWR